MLTIQGEGFDAYMMNVKNHHLYSSKFTLSVVDLDKINTATKEDRAWEIDRWARLFKATTWEELKMIAKENEAMQEASETLYNMHCEQTVRDMARARQDFYRQQSYIEHRMASLEADKEKLTSDNEKLSSDNEKLSSDNEKLSSDNEKLSSDNEKLSSDNEKLSSDNEKLSSALAEQASEIALLKQKLAEAGIS